MEAMAETKLLDFNTDKSVIIIIGNKKIRASLENEFQLNPPTLYGIKMKQVEQEKYLGEQISSGGLADCVTATISKRNGAVLQSIFEIRAVIDDCRSNVTGGIVAGLEIWEMAVIPYLLNNSECWTPLTENAVKSLDNLQNLFYRVLLGVPTGCPIPAMYWDCGGLTMENRILKKKLTFIHHVANLPETALASQIYQVQKKMSLPGLYQECSHYLTQFDIEEFPKYSKLQFKKVINDKILAKNKIDLLDRIRSKGYQKLDHKDLSEENFELKSYFLNLTLAEARMKFRLRTKLARTVKMNFSSDRKFTEQLWSCWHCPRVDTQTHVTVCPAYEHLRENLDFDNDKDLVKYFDQVIKLRDEMS